MEAVLNNETSVGILKGYTVRDVLMLDVPIIDDNVTMKDAACRLLHSHHKNFLVSRQGDLLGTVTRQDIIRVLYADGGRMFVRDAADRHLEYLSIGTPLDEAWARMQDSHKSMILVLEEDQLKGAIDEESIEEFILIHAAQSKN